MSKLPLLSYKDVLKVLSSFEIYPQSQKGSHIKVKGVYNGILRISVVPAHDEIMIGTLKSILKQLGISEDDFLKALK